MVACKKGDIPLCPTQAYPSQAAQASAVISSPCEIRVMAKL